MFKVYIFKNENQFGPYTENEIIEMLSEDKVSEADLAWCEGMTEWQPLSEVLAKALTKENGFLNQKTYSIEDYKRRTPATKHAGGQDSNFVHMMKGVSDVLRVYEDRVTITPEGLMGLLNKGLKGTKTIPFHSITAIQFKQAGWTSGYIQFTILGGNESRGGLLEAGTDENTFMFGGDLGLSDKSNTKAEEIKLFIEAKIRDIRTPKSAAANSLGDEIEKLADLKKRGILSEQEFQAAKMRLIG